MLKNNYLRIHDFSNLVVLNEKTGAYSRGVAITRVQDSDTLVIVSGSALSPVFNMQDFAGYGVLFHDALTGTPKLGFKVSDLQTGTFLPLYDDAGTLVEATIVSGTAVYLPEELFPWDFGMLWLESSAANVLQGANRTFILIKKG